MRLQCTLTFCFLGTMCKFFTHRVLTSLLIVVFFQQQHLQVHNSMAWSVYLRQSNTSRYTTAWHGQFTCGRATPPGTQQHGTVSLPAAEQHLQVHNSTAWSVYLRQSNTSRYITAWHGQFTCGRAREQHLHVYSSTA